jgi:EAL domain
MDAAVRRVLGAALQALSSDATLEEAAQAICDALTTLPGVDFTAVGAFLNADDAVLLASRAPDDFPIRVGDHLPAHRASKLWALSRGGPWAADFVKLDISLVRGVNVSLGRQALVVAMRHFARTAGCRLVAEGVETEDEARALTQLGVEFAQGYLFGRPEPAPDGSGLLNAD